MHKAPQEIQPTQDTNQPSNPKIVRIEWHAVPKQKEAAIEKLREIRNQEITHNMELAQKQRERARANAIGERKKYELLACEKYLGHLSLLKRVFPDNNKVISKETRKILNRSKREAESAQTDLHLYAQNVNDAFKIIPNIDTRNTSMAASRVLHHPSHNEDDYDQALIAEATYHTQNPK